MPPRAQREMAVFNEVIKTEIKQGRGVFFVLSVQEYDTHMHKPTQAGHCRDCHPRGTRAEHGPGAVGAAPSARPKHEALRFSFSQRKNRPNPPTQHTHKQPIISPPNFSNPISGDGVPYTG